MKDPSGHSLEIIMGLERARSQALHNISVQQAKLSNMAISHERARIQAKINSYQDNISEYERQIRIQKGQTTLDDVNIQKENDSKIDELIRQVKLLKIYRSCGESGLKLLEHELLDWLTPEERFSAVYLSQEKNKSTGELISGYNPLTVDDFVKLGIDKDSIHEDYLSLYNLAFKLSMHGTSIEEQEAQYSAKKRAELDATMRILVLQFASNSTRNLNQHSKYGVAKPVEGEGKADSFLEKSVPKAYRADVKSAFGTDAKVTTTTQDITVHRYYGGSSGSSSYWVTPNKYTNPSSKLALPPSNTAEYMQTYILPKGTQILEGTVAPQPQWSQLGGGYQYYIPDPSVLIHVK